VTLRAEAQQTLTAWTAPTPAQESLRLRYLDLLAARPDAAERTCAPDHLTAGVLVVDHTCEHVLMNLHGKAGIWVAFGGHCEPGDGSLVRAATRELVEESGLAATDLEVDPVIAQLDVHPVDFCKPHGRVDHLDVRFVARAAAGAVPEISEESIDIRWFPVDEGPTAEASMLDLIRIARERFTAPVE
jgi:8-oxo-dGTP pyrophosphatase MutT (NUDIX family)